MDIIASISTWSAARLLGATAGIAVVAVLTFVGLSTLILEKSLRVDEERATVFLSYEDHPECGAVLEFVNAEDLEAGDVISGDAAPCESRNLIIRVLQMLALIAGAGMLLWLVWTWVGSREAEAQAPGAG